MKRRDSSIFDVYDVSLWQSVLIFLVCLVIKLWQSTIRFKVRGGAGLFKDIHSPIIVVIWHNRIFTTPMLMRRYHKKFPLAGLISPSKDGAILAEMFKNFGVQTVRGSSDRRGLASILELVRVLKSASICITTDGPRGPMYKIKKGVLKVAELSGQPIMAIRATYSSYITLKPAWDKFMLPLPFSTITLDGEKFTFEELAKDAQSRGITPERRLEQILGD